jgi:hypothetical protein
MFNEILNSKLEKIKKNDFYFKKQQEQQNNKKIKKIAQDFIQELLTSQNPPLKPNYGTTFIDDLGEIVNPYKFQYYLELNANKIIDKYDIESIQITKIDSAGNLLIGHLELTINGVKIPQEFEIDWSNKHFTTEDLVE